MTDETLEDLMPIINPDLDKIVSENVFKPVEDNPPKNEEIFICKTKKPTKELQGLQELQDDEKCKLQEPVKVEVKEKKKYPHLEKARATALANRQKKAKEKAELKEIEKNKKLELKEEKKKLRVEKNRTNARNNYHKKQEAKALLEAEEKEVWKESITNDKPTPVKMGLSYDEFEKYMDTYTNKKALKKPSKADPPPKPIIKPKPVIKQEPTPKKVSPKPVKVIQSIHPIGYYNPHKRNKIDMDDLFSF